MSDILHDRVSELCDLAKSGEQDWLAQVDRVVHAYVADAGADIAAGRRELADAFRVLAPDRERSRQIVERILGG